MSEPRKLPRAGDPPAQPIDPEAEAQATPEPDAEGYIRPEQQPVIGQTRTYDRPPLPEPQPLHPQAPERYYAGPALGDSWLDERDPAAGLAPLDRSAIRCQYCGSNIGVFYRDPYTGVTRHQGCSPTVTRGLGQRREISVKDAKRELQPPEPSDKPL